MLSYLFGASKEKEVKPEPECPQQAMQESLTSHGKFELGEDGILKFEHLMYLRSVIIRQGNRQFNQARESLQQAKLEAFKADDTEKYMNIHNEGQNHYNECMMELTKKACEFVEIDDEKEYIFSVNRHCEDQEKANQINSLDASIREQLDKKEITEDRDIFIKALKTKITRDIELQRRLASIKQSVPAEGLQHIEVLEHSKTSDAILDKFGFDQGHLNKGIKHYDLLKSQEVIAFQKLCAAQQKSEEMRILKMITPPDEQVDGMIEEAMALGKPEINEQGWMTFDFWLKSQKIIQHHVLLFTQSGIAERCAKRRAFLKEENMKDFEATLQTQANWERLCGMKMIELYYANPVCNLTRECAEGSTQQYLADPEKRTEYEEMVEALRIQVQGKDFKELTRDEVLDSVDRLELSKFEAQKIVFEIVRQKRLPSNVINQILKMEQIKAEDDFFNQTGFEESCVQPNIERLSMEKDEAFLAIIKKYEDLSTEYLAKKKEETEALVKQVAQTTTNVEEQLKKKSE